MQNAEVVYTLLTGFVIIQFVMLVVGLFSAKIAPRILSVPYNLLMPAILLFCVVGSFTLQNSLWDVKVALLFGLIGYFMKKHNYPPAPLVLGVILGPMAEERIGLLQTTMIGLSWSAAPHPVLPHLVGGVHLDCTVAIGSQEENQPGSVGSKEGWAGIYEMEVW